MALTLSIAIAIIAITLAFSLRWARHSSEFLLCSHSITLWPLVATLVMTEFNIATLLAFSSLGYIAGPMALAMPLLFLVGIGFYSMVVAKKWANRRDYSVAAIFTERYGVAYGRFVSVALLIGLIGFCATYITSLTLLLSPYLSVNHWVASAFFCLLPVLLASSGGLRSVVRIDVISVLLTFLLVGWLCFYTMQHYQWDDLLRVFEPSQMTISPIAQWHHPVLPWQFITSLLVLTCFTYIAAPWYGQKMFAARDGKTAMNAAGISAVIVFILYGGLVLSAAFYHLDNNDLIDPQTAIPHMLVAWMPPAVAGVGFGVLLLAGLTTLVGCWSAMVAMLVNDIAPRYRESLHAQRWITLGVAFICWVAANLMTNDLLQRIILANIPTAAISFALLAAFYYHRATPQAAWASTIVGISWAVGCYIIIGEEGGYTWYWAIYGIPLTFATGFLVSRFQPASK